ncbi:hypothetical protein GCM10009731_38690 [Streptomyces globosus]
MRDGAVSAACASGAGGGADCAAWGPSPPSSVPKALEDMIPPAMAATAHAPTTDIRYPALNPKSPLPLIVFAPVRA